MRLLRSRKWRAAAITLTVLAAGCGGFLYRYWDEVKAYADREYRRYWHADGSDAFCRDMASGRFRAGDSVEDLIAAHPPQQICHIGQYTILRIKSRSRGVSYPPGGGHVVAKDGRLARVSLGNWDAFGAVELFNTLTPADEAAMLAGRIALSRAQQEACMAVVGPPIMQPR